MTAGRVLWGDPSQRAYDVSGAYTHTTVVAENATELRNGGCGFCRSVTH